MKKTTILLHLMLALTLGLASCGNKHYSEPMADTGRTERTEHLLTNLTTLADKGRMLIGHYNDGLHGVGWKGDSARSDIKSVCGDEPAVLAMCIHGVETDRAYRADSISYDQLRRAAISQFIRGGCVQLDWPADLSHNAPAFEQQVDSVAAFISSLRDEYGILVPVILRPYLEDRNLPHGRDKTYARELWRTLKRRISKAEVPNVLLVYTVYDHWDESAYPGDDVVDIIGLSKVLPKKQYASADDTALAASHFAADLSDVLGELQQVTMQHPKPLALVKVGMECIAYRDFFAELLLPVLEGYKVSYAVLGSNAHDGTSYYAPFPGHPAVSSFIRFYNSPHTVFLHNANGLYL